MLHHHPEHLESFDYLGRYRYFLTFTTYWRRPHFTSPEVVALALSQIQRAAHLLEFAIPAYCFMPDHLHLLVEGESDASDCKRFIARAKQFSGFAHSQAFGEPLWQKYGYEHVLRGDEDTRAVARYILENPLRAKLVKDVETYPFVGSDRYSLRDLLEHAGDWSG